MGGQTLDESKELGEKNGSVYQDTFRCRFKKIQPEISSKVGDLLLALGLPVEVWLKWQHRGFAHSNFWLCSSLPRSPCPWVCSVDRSVSGRGKMTADSLRRPYSWLGTNIGPKGLHVPSYVEKA